MFRLGNSKAAAHVAVDLQLGLSQICSKICLKCFQKFPKIFTYYASQCSSKLTLKKFKLMLTKAYYNYSFVVSKANISFTTTCNFLANWLICISLPFLCKILLHGTFFPSNKTTLINIARKTS